MSKELDKGIIVINLDNVPYIGPSSYQVLLKWNNGPKRYICQKTLTRLRYLYILRILVLSKPNAEINKAVNAAVTYLRSKAVEVY